MCKPDQRVHQSKLARMIEFQAGYAFAAGKNGRLGELAQLAAVDECLQDVLLNILVVVDDGRELLPQLRKVLDRLVDSIVVHVVRRRLCPQNQMVPDILLDEAIAVMAADDGIGQVHDPRSRFAACRDSGW